MLEFNGRRLLVVLHSKSPESQYWATARFEPGRETEDERACAPSSHLREWLARAPPAAHTEPFPLPPRPPSGKVGDPCSTAPDGRKGAKSLQPASHHQGFAHPGAPAFLAKDLSPVLRLLSRYLKALRGRFSDEEGVPGASPRPLGGCVAAGGGNRVGLRKASSPGPSFSDLPLSPSPLGGPEGLAEGVGGRRSVRWRPTWRRRWS